MQTDILNYFFRLICDKMSSYNLPIVTQSLLRGHYLHYCGIFLARFLVCFVFNKVAIAFWFRTLFESGHNRSWKNFKPSYGLSHLAHEMSLWNN